MTAFCRRLSYFPLETANPPHDVVGLNAQKRAKGHAKDKR